MCCSDSLLREVNLLKALLHESAIGAARAQKDSEKSR
jgi:hypothetical protein